MDSTTENVELTRPTLTPGEACPTCGALVAGDQRYCVECGERQGAPRFALPAGRTIATTPAPAPRRRPSAGASTTFVLGVATLLVAMAVGVLIGRSGPERGSQASAPVRVVTVGGTGAAAGTTAAATATAAPATSGKTKVAKHPKASPTPITVKVVKTPPPTVQLGQKGSGPGYKNGRFTGDFFGP